MDETDLTEAQQAAIDFLYERDSALMMLPVGFGKTVCTQTAVEEMLRHNALERVLIVAPLRVCTDVWATEWEQWDHLLEAPALCVGPVGDRRGAVESDAKVLVVNYENLPWLLKEYGNGRCDGLVLDEITKVKGGGSQFKALRRHLGEFTWRVGLSGTLVSEGLDKLFYPVMAVDGGERLGRNQEKFLRRWFYPEDWEQRRWLPFPGSDREIAAALEDVIFRADYADDTGGRPEIEWALIATQMPEQSREYYRQMLKHMVVDIGGEVEAPNAAVKSGKLQQIAAGFLYADDEVMTLDTTRIREALAWGLATEGQLLICYRYDWELEQLRERVPDGRELRDNGAVDSWGSGALGVMFLHAASGGHGLNLQTSGCARVLFLGPLWSHDQRDQVVGRVARRGNPSSVVRVGVAYSVGTVEDGVLLPRVADKGERARLFARHVREWS